jgi:hypothetical protein
LDLRDFNSEKYIAKYTKFDRVLKDILPFNEIRISSANKVNDPYENDKNWFAEDRTLGNEKEKIQEVEEMFSDINDKLFSHIKLFCVTGYRQKKRHERDISDHIYCKPRMWATYGDNHKGVCLIFDKNELSENFKIQENLKEFNYICDRKVDYLDFISHINNNIFVTPNELRKFYKGPNKYDSKKLFSLIKNYSDNMLELKYSRKHIDWESEDEYRWLIFSENTEDLDINYGKSLKAIILGINVDPKYKKIIENYTSVPLYQITFNDGKYDTNKILKTSG